MNKIRRWIIISLILVGIIDTVLIMSPNYLERSEFSIVELSRLAKSAAVNMENPKLQTMDCTFDYVILDKANHLIYQNSAFKVSSLQEAIREKSIYYPIIKGTELLGYVIMNDHTNQVSKLNGKKQILILIALSLLLEGCFCIALSCIYRNMIRPFNKMQVFAQDIAMGNLDRPLDMDQDNLFGAFTESFDIMREELKKARSLEAQANESKKELVASLSHDIKTPVTAIKLISDILLVKLNDDVLKKKVKTIYKKANQIDLLITDMFHATLEELGELSVEPVDMESSQVKEIIENADYNNRVIELMKIPECIIRVDPVRLQQVFTNVISNSYKYADTEIQIVSFLEEYYLVIEVRDFGPGVPIDEIHLVFEKFYRSKESYVKEKQGAGLGLYIARSLLEKMGSGISCYNEEPGFVIKLSIPLS